MAEAGIAAFGVAAGVAITMAIVAFSLRQRRPHGPEMDEIDFPEPTRMSGLLASAMLKEKYFGTPIALI